MIFTQTNAILRRLAVLSCAVEDYQSFMEAGDELDAAESARMVLENVEAIREALDKIEAQVKPSLEQSVRSIRSVA